MFLCLGIFVCLFAIGSGLITVCLGERCEGRHYLAAPAVGMAALVLPTIVLNRLTNLPIGHFAVPLVAIIFVAAIAVLWRRADRRLLRSNWPIVAIAVCSIFLIGWPLLEFGLDWLSFTNDDMTNYALSAEHLMKSGYSTVPALSAYILQQNATDPFFLYLHYERYATDALLALFASVSGVATFGAFMPVILAFNASLIMSAAFLVYRNPSLRIQSIVTALFLAISPLTTLGTMYQLFAQVAGLAMAGTAIGLLAETFFEGRKPKLPELILAAIVLAGTTEIYPEILPFVFVPLALFVGLKVLATRSLSMINVRACAIVGAFTIIMINAYLSNVSAVYVQRFVQTSKPLESGSLFPYYLVPSGFANFAGTIAVAAYPSEPKLSILIAGGMAVILILVVATIREARTNPLVASCSMFCLFLAVYFFAKHSDFALYKLAMYMQPFSIAVLVLAASRLDLFSWPKAPRVVV